MEKSLYYKEEPKFDNDYKIVKKELYSEGINCFPTKEEAIRHYKKAFQVAADKHSQIMNAIEKIKEEIIDFRFDYYMKGDTYGIYEEGSYIGIIVERYEFKFLL